MGLGKKNFHSNLPLSPLRQDLIWFLRDLEWETSGLLKFTCFGPFGFEEKLLCLSSNLPSGYCVCFFKTGSVQEGGDEQGLYLCVVSASCVECVFSEDSGATLGSALGWRRGGL